MHASSLRFRSWLRGSVLLALFAGAGLLASGCDILSASESAGPVSLAFETATPATSASAGKRSETTDLTIEGPNGTLTISRLALVVGEFELEGAEEESEEDEESKTEESESESETEDEEESGEFERGPFWTDVPLDGSAVEVTAGKAPEGTYESLSFEVEDLEDEEEGEEAAQIQAIRTELQSEFSTWPNKASMVAIGSFTPDGGSAQSFTTFFEAEIEIEKTLSPPLDIQGGSNGQQVTVKIDPARWFTQTDGTVRDLSAHDYQETGQLLKFEVEIEEGFTETEIEEEFEEEETGEDEED